MKKLDLVNVGYDKNLYLYSKNDTNKVIYEVEKTDIDNPKETERDDDVVPIISHPFSANDFSDNLFSNTNDVLKRYEKIKFENIPEDVMMKAIEKYVHDECRVDYEPDSNCFSVYKDDEVVAKGEYFNVVFGVYNGDEAISDGNGPMALSGNFEQDKEYIARGIYVAMDDTFTQSNYICNTSITLEQLENAGYIDTEKYIAFAEPVETEYGCYGNYLLAEDANGLLSPDKAELRDGILKGDIHVFSAWSENRVYAVNEYNNVEAIQNNTEICFGEKDVECVIPDNAVELGFYNSIDECIADNHGLLFNDVKIEASTPAISSDDNYLEGSIVVEDLAHDEKASFGYDYKIETGEIELHKYTEPSRIDGSSFETNLPNLIEENIDDVLYKVESKCDEYIEKNGLNMDENEHKMPLEAEIWYAEMNQADEPETDEKTQEKDDQER